MKEEFLHFVWKLRYINSPNLVTTSGKSIVIKQPGNHNHDSGPDFVNVELEIDGLGWVGNVEMHVNSSEWNDHGHQSDAAYNSVILHVVWEDNEPVHRQDGSQIPTLELAGKIESSLLARYESLSTSIADIPCANYLTQIPPITRLEMMDASVSQRLATKSYQFLQLLQQNGNDWNEACYQHLASNFGFKVNAQPFQRLSQALPLKLLNKHADSSLQQEALLFGMAGYLRANQKQSYFKQLKSEFAFLNKKYGLQSAIMEGHEWKFLRMRPANFPTVRIAQFASFINSNSDLLSTILNTDNVEDILSSNVSQSSFWKEHYRFGQSEKRRVPLMGKSSKENLVINTFSPIQFAYGELNDLPHYKLQSLNLLQQVRPEKNKVTRRWQDYGIKATNALESQALIEQYNNFCLQKKCLSCKIGAAVMKRKP